MVLSRSIFLAFRRYPSKINLIRASVYPNCFSKLKISVFSQPIFSNPAIHNGFKSIRAPIQKSFFSTTRSYHNCLSKSKISRPNSAIQSPFLIAAKRFYHVCKVELPIKTLSFSPYIFSFYIFIAVVPLYSENQVFLNENLEIVPFLKRIHCVNVSTETETELGQQTFDKNVQREKILPSDHPDSIRVQGIAKNIIEALQIRLEIEKGSFETDVSRDERQVKYGSRHLEGLRWEIVVVDSPEKNAWCAPGGKIIMFTEFLKHLSSDEAIAFVMGHEVAHVVARHKAEKLTKLSKFNWLLIPLQFLGYFLPFCLLKDVAQLLLFPLTVRTEIEADYIGLLLMASAGYDPRMARGTLKDDSLFTCYRESLWSQGEVMQEAMDIYTETIGKSSVPPTTITNLE